MKKKKIKNLALNKKSISDLQSRSISGKGSLYLTDLCIPTTTVVTSYLISCIGECSGDCIKPTIP